MMEKIKIIIIMIMVAVNVYSSELKFITHELKPFTWQDEKENKTKGIVYDLCSETIMRMGYKNPKIEIYPFARALKIVQEEDSYLLFHIQRTAARENSVKWVGPIISNGVYFYKNKSSKFKSETLDDMKKLKLIGIGRGTAAHTFLKENNFTNLYDVTNEMQLVDMLAKDRVEAFAMGEMVVNETARQSGIDIKLFEKTKIKLYESVLYMGFSKNIPDSEIEKWQKVFDEVKREKYEELYKKYIEND